ncbi:hypothetical protein BDZ89DRAFT_1063978 [Hymenopellis radicata]|nr:hypothetical protein BDZ89DRAFT_1063978 [Hymenopellis radicata]
MSALTSVAVIGMNDLGRRVVEQLLVRRAYVVALQSHGSPQEVPRGCSVVRVEYSDLEGMTKGFKNYFVSIVVCCLDNEATHTQAIIARAAKAAGVTIFVPSETFLPLSRPLRAGADTYPQYLNSIGIPTLRIVSGIFIEQIPWLVSSPYAPGKMALVGSGDVKASFTSMIDVAGFLGHILMTYPADQLRGQVLHLEGQAASLDEIARLYRKDVVHLNSLDDPFATRLQNQIDRGFGRSGWDAGADVDGLSVASNALWENHRWRRIQDVLPATAFR